MNANNSLPVLTTTIFALLGDMSEYVPSLTEKRELFGSVREHTLHIPPRSDPAVPIRSDQIPEGSPLAYTRGVTWNPCTPTGYKTLDAHDADGELAMQVIVRERLVDPGLVDRVWVWLDRECPEMPSGAAIAAPELPAVRLLA
jgi:hypothetical protein